MRIDVFSIFPEFFTSPFDASLLGGLAAAALLELLLLVLMLVVQEVSVYTAQ